MQLVSAFSRPQTVPPVAKSVPKRNLWILNSWRDLILYVGTPLLLLPLFAPAHARWSAQDTGEGAEQFRDDADAAENLRFALASGRAGDSIQR